MLLALALAAALETGSAAHAPLPRGWREPTPREVSEGLATWRALNAGVHLEPGEERPGDPKFALDGDFDGDGRSDRALILLNPSRDKAGLFILRAGKRRYEALQTYAGFDGFLESHDLDARPPGTYQDACARGLGDARAPCRRNATTRWTAVMIGKAEAWAMLYFWNGKRFDTVLLTD